MAFQKFSEYLIGKKEFQTKAKVSLDGDTGPSGTETPKPPKAANKGKNWTAEAAQVTGDGNENPKPYSAPGTDPGQPTYEKGLTYKGDQNLIYKPKAEDQKLKTDVKKENFIETTQNMHVSEYVDYVLNTQGGTVINKILDTVELIDNDQNLFETFVREVKRTNNFSKFMAAVLNQPETYKEIASYLANEETSKSAAVQLAKAINETVSPSDEEDTLPEPKPTKTVKGTPTGGADNIKQSKKLLKPEHHIIEALSTYKNLRKLMQSMLD